MSNSEVLTQKSGGNTDPPTPVRSRSWTLTLWDKEALKKLLATKPAYVIYAPEECPSTKKPHFQCYAYYKTQRFQTAMRTLFKGHDVRQAFGSAEENRKYIAGPYNKNGKVKEVNDNAVELGTIPEQGKRNDLAEFHAAIQAGKRGRNLSEDHLGSRAKFPRLESTLIYENDKLRAQQQYNNGDKPDVHVRWGKPGTGKSRYVYDEHKAENIYELNLGDGNSKSVWWSGYEGESIILINDFNGELQWKYLLRLLDRYPFQMQTKGGHCWRLCKSIYITSNSHPMDWYPNEEWGPLQRRLNTITEVK